MPPLWIDGIEVQAQARRTPVTAAPAVAEAPPSSQADFGVVTPASGMGRQGAGSQGQANNTFDVARSKTAAACLAFGSVGERWGRWVSSGGGPHGQQLQAHGKFGQHQACRGTAGLGQRGRLSVLA